MRIMTSLLSPLTAVALCAAIVQPAAAQGAYVSPTAARAAVAADAPAVRTIAVYRFTASRLLRLPTLITVADSAGQLVANFRLLNVSRPAAMTVDVMGNDIVLQGETASGLLTLVLYRQNDAESASSFIGWWSLGDEHGDLRGRTAR